MRTSARFFVVVATVALAATLVVRSDTMANQTVNCTTSGNVTTCRVDQPIVTQRLTTYPQIVFQPNDSVLVTAGGCVQTGGTGKTWKLYVNPQGPNADRLYHGLIQLPGVESDLVRLQGVVGHAVSIPTTIDPKNAALRLGYEDDKYSDNGYWGHDDGTGNQCKNVGDAFVVLQITHNATTVQTKNAPFDLVWTQVDPNFFPLNPEWAFQRDNGGQLPDADHLCFDLSGIFSNPSCTTQAPSIDTPSGWNGFWCSHWSEHSIDGHVNWMPATWQGPIVWDVHSPPGSDDDYNVYLTPPNQAGLTTNSAGTILAEFDSDETIDNFTETWWETFHKTVDSGDAAAHKLIDGKTAIIVGLTGLDCEHGCATELHPVYGLAIQLNDDPSDNQWAIFVRNWGDEGYCSQYQHYVDTETVSFLIPQFRAAGVQTSNATFYTNSNAAWGPSVALVAGQGATVTFGLPPPSQRGFIDGEIHFKWTVSQLHVPETFHPIIRAAALRAPSESDVDVEARIGTIVHTLPSKTLATLRGPASAAAKPITLKSAAHVAFVKPTKAATVTTVVDTQKAARDLARGRALCAAYHNTIPGGPPNVCANLPK